MVTNVQLLSTLPDLWQSKKPCVCVYMCVFKCVYQRMCVCGCVCVSTHTQTVVLVTSEALWPPFLCPEKWRKNKQNKSDFYFKNVASSFNPKQQTALGKQTEKKQRNVTLDLQHGRLKPQQSSASWNNGNPPQQPDGPDQERQTQLWLSGGPHSADVRRTCATEEILLTWSYFIILLTAQSDGAQINGVVVLDSKY